MGWLKIKETQCFTVLEDRSLKSTCKQSHASSEIRGGKVFPFLLSSSNGRNPWHSLVCSCATLFSASVTTWHSSYVSLCLCSRGLLLSVCLCSNFLLTRTPVIGVSPSPCPKSIMTSLIILAKSLFPNKVTVKGTRGHLAALDLNLSSWDLLVAAHRIFS